MRNLKFLLISILFLVVVGLFLVETNTQANMLFRAQSLMNASDDEIQKVAVDYTYGRFNVLSGTPTVLLTRSVVKDELPSLGLSAIDFGGEEPPLKLVVMKGDFDVSSIRRSVKSSSPLRASYIVYVFDLKVGAPTLIQYSLDGSHFRKLLNDPTLPEVAPAPNVVNEPALDISPLTPGPKLPYGSVAPTVMPPSVAP